MDQTFLELPITDPILTFAVVMLIVLVAPLLFKRMGIPGIVGLIVFGAIAGESVLGLFEVNETFELLGRVGLLYLMFMAGLSLDLNQFVKYKSRSLVFGLLSIFFPLVLAVGIGTSVLDYSMATSLLIGAVVGSHTLLAYPVAERLGITKNLAVTMTMGGTMVTDLVSLLLLAIVAATVEGAVGLSFWLIFAGLVLAYGVGVAYILPRLGRWFFRTVRDQPDLEFVFLLAVVFTTAYLAEVVYLAPIIGAFFAGIILNRLVPDRSSLMLRIKFVGDSLFIPFFLIYVGLLVDVGVLIEGFEVAGLALVLAGLVWAGKLIAAKLAQWFYQYTADEGWTIFGLSTPQSAATLAVTLVGFEIGLFDEALLNAVVVLILLTCLVGPWLVERFGRRVALQEEQKPYDAEQAPQRILVPLSNPDTAEDLIDLSVLLHDSMSEEPIYPATVVSGDSPERVAQGEELLSRAVLRVSASEMTAVPITRVDLNIAGGIRRAMKENRISTVVIGWHGGSSARQYIFGSVLDQLLEETREMVVVSRVARPINTHDRLLLAAPPYAEREAGFPDAIRALKILSDRAGMELVLLTPEHARETLQRRMEEINPSVPITSHPLPRWKQLMETLDTLATPSDMIVLLSEREGSLAWRPSLDRMPGIIVSRFEENTFLTTYMAERPFSALIGKEAKKLGPDVLRRAIKRAHVTIGLEQESVQEVLRQVVAPILSVVDGQIDRIVRDLAVENEDYAPEISPGIVVYHEHAKRIEETLLFAGISREGLRIPRASGPVHVVLVFIGASGLSAEGYLNRLSVITEITSSEETVEALRQCTNSEEARDVLMQNLTELEAVRD